MFQKQKRGSKILEDINIVLNNELDFKRVVITIITDNSCNHQIFPKQ